jgi:4-amino-4-deoxy-L-arabinose transferase-like glycosyltransferase
MRRTLPLLILAVIVLGGFGLRVYDLGQNPPGFFTDEAVAGLNAYTILANGTDQYGTPFPVFFKAFGEYRGGVGIYTTVPFVALFGLTEFGIRMTSAFFGTLSIVLLYFFVLELLKNHRARTPIALLSAAFLALSPWHLHYSRIGWDGYMQFLSLTLLGLWLFLKAQEKPALLPWSIGCFGLALYSYFPARVFVPLLGLGLLLLNVMFFLKNRQETLAAACVLFIILLPFITFHLQPEAWNKWEWNSIVAHPPARESIIRHAAANYLDHFSPRFLFLEGDLAQRHNVRKFGELYLFQLPLILAGLFALWNKKYRLAFWTIAVWLLFYPVAQAMTSDIYATATRSIIGVVPFQVLSAAGAVSLILAIPARQKALRTLAAVVLAFIAVCSAAAYTQEYFVAYPRYAAGWDGWQHGAGDIVRHFIAVQDQYDDLIMQPAFNGPDVLLAFYSRNYADGCSKCTLANNFDKYNPQRSQLYAVTPATLNQSRFAEDFVVQKTLRYPDGSVAFLIGEPAPRKG